MNRIVLIVLSLWFTSSPVMALEAGETVSNILKVDGAAGNLQLPIPGGQWEVQFARTRFGTGGGQAKMRDYGLFLAADGYLKSALEITAYTDTRNMRWTDEPCKVTGNVIFKNDYGTRLWKQKCLVVQTLGFLQKNNQPTMDALAALAKRDLKNDFVGLRVTYTRYDDRNRFFTYKYWVFPGAYGLDNPNVAVGSSPWYPGRLEKDPERSAFLDAVKRYTDGLVQALDAAFENREAPQISEFIYPPEQPAQKKTTAASEQIQSSGDLEEKLTLLQSLHSKGLLTDGEYSQKKAELLQKLQVK